MRNLLRASHKLGINCEIAAIPIVIASNGPLGHGLRKRIRNKSGDIIVAGTCFDLLNGRIIWLF